MLHFVIDYEGCYADAISKELDKFEDTDVVEHFDASHVDGTNKYAVSVDVDPSAKLLTRWKKALTEAVWRANNGLYVTVTSLTEDQYEEYL